MDECIKVCKRTLIGCVDRVYKIALTGCVRVSR